MWVVCISCHHTVELKPLPRNRVLRCTACGSRVARTVRVIKMSHLNGGQMPAETARIVTHAGLISIAVHRGYKRGWAAMKYKAIYGYWPSWDDPEPQNPSGELSWWVKREGKAYAKAMREREGEQPLEDLQLLATPADSVLMSAEDWEVDL